MLKVVAFDIGTTSAWATNLRQQTPRWGSLTLEGPRAHRLAAFDKFLRNECGWMQRADVIIYETPIGVSMASKRILWGISAIIEVHATRLLLPVLDQHPATIKKFATGRGDAPKNTMTAAAQRLGYKGDNEHEADAYCLLKYAEENLERGEIK